ncbi:biotin/lipoate--protein ligase family protein [Roseobacter ponti]|uniref:DUF4444 domain-containing protein n=1 Tax=Roseobacter ponti TaxID=1891787 RepID=A0A858SVA6_9RHOB|nr:biotin/lipoate--protein ligase family protein [Roseobacter ponti]QJF51762.1 DUF4444 domain-containing protein [Roseobacter ponti]
MSGPQFPPLFTAMATAGADPLAAACAEARKGCDAGLVTWDISPALLRAAIVLAPEVPLREAMIMLPVCGIGFQNALGALAPPEVSVHLGWSGALLVNGGTCGQLTPVASAKDPDAEPDWLVIGLEVTLSREEEDTGLTPDETDLFTEGCSEIEAADLLEAWVRHTLVWINRWSEDGTRPVHSEWQGLAQGLNEETTAEGHTGTFLGVDESFGMLLQSGESTTIIPLTTTLRDIP